MPFYNTEFVRSDFNIINQIVEAAFFDLSKASDSSYREIPMEYSKIIILFVLQLPWSKAIEPTVLIKYSSEYVIRLA